MGKPYMKLDFDWYEDPKVLDFQDRHGKAALVDLIKLFCVMGEFYGQIDLKDNAQKLRLQKVLNKRGKALVAFIDKVANCDLVDAEAWKGLQRIGSDRSIRDGTARRNRRQYALDASKAAQEKRKEGSSLPFESP